MNAIAIHRCNACDSPSPLHTLCPDQPIRVGFLSSNSKNDASTCAKINMKMPIDWNEKYKKNCRFYSFHALFYIVQSTATTTTAAAICSLNIMCSGKQPRILSLVKRSNICIIEIEMSSASPETKWPADEEYSSATVVFFLTSFVWFLSRSFTCLNGCNDRMCARSLFTYSP